MSPMPSSLDTNGCGANRSRSFKCSPTPRKMIGVLVAATLIRHDLQLAVVSRLDQQSLRGDGTSSLGMSIKLRDDDRTEI